MSSRVLRFAPSPNGYLHLGHAYSAMLNHAMAAEVSARLLLRIEDIDAARCRPEYEAAIYRDLDWLGIAWHRSVRRQREHRGDYAAALARLEARGLIYPSFESRSAITALVAARECQPGHWPRDPDGALLYPGHAHTLSADEGARRRSAGEPFALRLDMEAAVEAAAARAATLSWTETGSGPQGQAGVVAAAPRMWGDVVLARRDAPVSYHLAVVVDDALQGVSDIVRGQDLFWSTSIHRLLQVLLGLPQPSYHHHRLIRDADGRKLSKSTKATSLRELRAGGAGAADIRRMVGLGR